MPKPSALLLAGVTALGAMPAAAQDVTQALRDLPVIGTPQAGGLGFQPAATSLAADLQWLDGFLLVIITVIALFVTGLLAWVILRYNNKANKEPAQFTHNSPLEVTWTVVPILILVGIGAFSLPVLFDQQRIPEGDVVVKVSGFQWAWEYEYPDEDITFSSYMIGAPGSATAELLTDEEQETLAFVDNAMSPSTALQLERAGYSEDLFRLATDTSIVVPVGKTIVMQVTALDVIHSWTIPAFGVKQDGIPGRLAQLWFEADQEGVYFGQCSELCGIAHAYMPITVKVVSEEVYAAWLEEMKTGDMVTW
ncbi:MULTISPECIES: cytochrome c oxidase subunit II [Jannaschia]